MNCKCNRFLLLTIDLMDREKRHRSDLVQYNIEGLYSLKSLHLRANTEKIDFSIKNLPVLIDLSFYSRSYIDENIVTGLLDQLSHIKELLLDGYLSYFNLDSLVNLKKLSLVGNKNWNFNLELFENLCKQLENIKISICNINENDFLKLFDGCNFPYLEDFTIESLYMIRLKKEFIDRLPKTKKLNINKCGIEVIESDLFSNMQQLNLLDLSYNRIEYIVENA